jgi:DNA-binding YbaB/EbfC family protein
MTDLRSLMQLGQQMQGRLAEMQSQLAQRSVTGSAGGGMVTVEADGRGQVRTVHIDPSLLAGDVELLEELVAAAVADLQKRVAEVAQDEMRKLQSGLPFPLPFSL